MARQPLNKEFHTDSVGQDHLAPIIGGQHKHDARADGDIDIEIVHNLDKDYADALNFEEEPVTIRIEQGSDDNSPAVHYLSVNGRFAELLIDGKWRQAPGGYVPCNIPFTTKRKYVGVLLGSKKTRINTRTVHKSDGGKEDVIDRFTSRTVSFSILEDRNPRGGAWATEMARRPSV